MSGVRKWSHWAARAPALLAAVVAASSVALGQPTKRLTISTSAITMMHQGEPFAFVRPVGASRLSDGSVAVVEAEDQRIHVFGMDGNLVASAGGKGQGPGELEFATSIRAVGDSFAVVEASPGPNRVSYFRVGQQGTRKVIRFLSRRMLSHGSPPETVTPLAMTASGVLIVSPGGMRVYRPPPVMQSRRDSLTVGVLAPAEGSLKWVGRFAGATMTTYPLPRVRAGAGVAVQRMRGSLQVAGGASEVWVGDTESGVVRAFDRAGEVKATLRLVAPPVAATMRAIDALRDDELTEVTTEPDSARVRAEFSTTGWLGTPPLFKRIVPANDDRLWVERWPAAVGESIVTVTGQHGEAVSVLIHPSRFRLVEVSDGQAILFRTTDSGFINVQMARIGGG